MKIVTDAQAGFCFGVINAIRKVENYLEQNRRLYCLGEIVHNEKEVGRLKEKGLQVISHADLKELKDEVVLIRAHGEPPQTYQIARENNIELIDATCPIVLRLQKKVKEAEGKGKVIIFGKMEHPEVVGLAGQLETPPVIIRSMEELKALDINGQISLFSQTTMDKEEYEKIKEEAEIRSENGFECVNSICRQVYNRKEKLREFANSFNCIVFVGGSKSSNAKVLFNICKEVNPNTFFVNDETMIKAKWLKNIESVGITGATSTPKWLLKKVSETINKMSNL
jgi:4-hydroxy-3-methylbut-2-enyl diphosphate reductase